MAIRQMFRRVFLSPGGELFHHLDRRGQFSELDTRFYISEILLGLEYLHSQERGRSLRKMVGLFSVWFVRTHLGVPIVNGLLFVDLFFVCYHGLKMVYWCLLLLIFDCRLFGPNLWSQVAWCFARGFCTVTWSRRIACLTPKALWFFCLVVWLNVVHLQFGCYNTDDMTIDDGWYSYILVIWWLPMWQEYGSNGTPPIGFEKFNASFWRAAAINQQRLTSRSFARNELNKSLDTNGLWKRLSQSKW